MLATDRFLLISIGRTGTGALHKWLQEVPGLRIVSNLPHEKYDVMAANCIAAGLAVPPAWTIIRNPWDYYVDKFCWERDKGPCFQGTFKEFLQRTREQPTVGGFFYSLTQKWNDLGADACTQVARFENYDKDVPNILASFLAGLCSWYDIKGRIENNRGYGESYMADGKPQWTSGYKDYYCDETRAWVRELDGELIDRFGYVG
jgi:hypothetical protein